MLEAIIWIVYIGIFLYLARLGKGYDIATAGKVGFFIQSLSYVATYISAVALIGFGGLAYMYGLQMLLVAFGNVLLGTWLVYKYFAWPTKQMQVQLQARTPAQLLGRGHNSVFLKKFLGLVFAFFLAIYASAAIKGAAIMLGNILPYSLSTISFLLACLVGLVVWWGGLRGVLLTEAMQGCVMLIGIILLAYSVLSSVGGVVTGYEALSKLPPSQLANNGFTSLSSGSNFYFILSLVLVTSIAVWAQPQMIQRHFAIGSKKEISKSIWFATFSILILLGGMYFISALSRLILPEINNPDDVIPTLVNMLLPSFGEQLFTLAIASASLSTCTALFHIAAVSLTVDLISKEEKAKSLKEEKTLWALGILFCILVSSGTSLLEGQIIALIHTTSWSLIGASALVPYLTLVLMKHQAPKAAVCSSIVGFITCLAFYLLFTPNTAIVSPDLFPVSNTFKAFPPFIIGLAFSILTYSLLFICSEHKKHETLP